MPKVSRIDWVDYAKGICIILVVMMHSTLGVEKAAGAESWLNPFIEWAKPFRMPDFFLISGLFLASRIDRPWRSYLETKVVHFAYFYVLWMTIQFTLRAPGIAAEQGVMGLAQAYLLGFVEPFGTLWFIYLLGLFFAVTKLLKPVPPLALFAAAAILEIAPIHTGSLLIDEFAGRFVYFYAGYCFAPRIFAYAELVRARPVPVILAGLFIWGMANAEMVNTGLAFLPVLSLVLGFIGAAAVVALGALLSRFDLARVVRYCGENSLAIYLAFVVFMAPTRMLLLKLGIPPDLAHVALIVTFVSIAGALTLQWATRGTRLGFLFKRPKLPFRPRARGSYTPPHAAGHTAQGR